MTYVTTSGFVDVNFTTGKHTELSVTLTHYEENQQLSQEQIVQDAIKLVKTELGISLAANCFEIHCQ